MSLDEPPTGAQVTAITRMCMALGIKAPLEERVRTRREARDTIYELRGKLRGKHKKGAYGH